MVDHIYHKQNPAQYELVPYTEFEPELSLHLHTVYLNKKRNALLSNGKYEFIVNLVKRNVNRDLYFVFQFIIENEKFVFH